jgi:uncharacterized protein (TIGR03437 family)
MSRALLLLLALAFPALAQFSELAATDDGSRLYFTTQLVLSDSVPTRPQYRIYRLEPNSLTLFAARPEPTGPNISFSNADGAHSPQVSGDGKVVGATFSSPSEAQLLAPQTVDLGPGNLQLSRNGRWALIVSDLSPNAPQTATLMDLSTGQRTAVPPPPPGVIRAVASDGTVLAQQNGIGLWKAGQFTLIRFAIGLGLRPLALSDDAGTLILGGISLNPAAFKSDLLAMNLATGQMTSFYSTLDSKQMPVFMAASNDGRRVLYRIGSPQGPQGPAYSGDTLTGESTPVALPAGELVSDGTLTGPGDLAFLVTTSGRIVKVTLASVTVETLIPPTPYARNLPLLTPGSLYPLQGTAGARIVLNGQPMPVIYSTAAEVGVQVPWEQKTGEVPFLVDSFGSTPFEQNQLVWVTPLAIGFWPAEPGQSGLFGMKVIKGDWSGYVTSQPGPGEVFYIYMSGLGAVSGPVQTGVPASLTTLNPVQGTLNCSFGGVPAQTLFVGLAPGTVGIYIAAFRMPDNAAGERPNSLFCNFSGAGGTSSIGAAGITPPQP